MRMRTPGRETPAGNVSAPSETALSISAPVPVDQMPQKDVRRLRPSELNRDTPQAAVGGFDGTGEVRDCAESTSWFDPVVPFRVEGVAFELYRGQFGV